MKYGPGSTVDKHTHGGGEEYIVLEGSFDDEHGHHAKGEYVRNPPTSEHTTHTEDGCEVFVKNWQMRLDGRSQVNIDLEDVDCVGVKGVLFEDDGETVFVQELAAGAFVRQAAIHSGLCLVQPWGQRLVVHWTILGDAVPMLHYFCPLPCHFVWCLAVNSSCGEQGYM